MKRDFGKDAWQGIGEPAKGRGYTKAGKLFALGLAVLMAAFVLASCGGSSQTSATTAAESSSTAGGEQQGQDAESVRAAVSESPAATERAEAQESAAGAEEKGDAEGESKAEAREVTEPLTIKVGASLSPHAEILEFAHDRLEEEGIDLVVITYEDYAQPDLALSQGEIDANYVQHQVYLDEFNEKNGTNLVSVGVIHFEPCGLYAGKSDDLSVIPEGAEIGIPNDAGDEARALRLLEASGILTLKDGAGTEATVQNIEENPHNVQILEMEAAEIPHSLADLDFAVMNGNYAIEAGIRISDALAAEEADAEAFQDYGNVIAVAEKNQNAAWVKVLVDVLQSDEIREFIESEYEGSAVPLPPDAG